jgi:3-deoxy-D-manno-octulosonic-acid transferase
MRILYILGVYVYGVAIHLASLFSPKAREWVKGRKDLFSTLPDVKDKHVYWFHCASLGEFDQGLPIMNRLKEKDPSIFLLVTFFSPSGYLNYHKRKHLADFVCYLPLDTPRNSTHFLVHFSPEKIFFVKYEFWGNYILKAKSMGCKLYSVAAIFRPEHRFFKWYGSFFRTILSSFDHFFVQNQQSVELLHSIGVKDVSLSGDTRFDRVVENKLKLHANPVIETFLGTEKAFVMGSSWSVDEAMIVPLINDGSILGKAIIAPHDISEKHLQEIEQRLTVSHVRYSELDSGVKSDAQVMILDTIGHLASAYAYGKIAYVGGGFTGKLHNILEPAVFGLPVLFGPKHTRFPEAQMYLDAGIGFSVSNSAEFLDAYRMVIESIDVLSEKTALFVEANAGATERIVNALA